MSTFDLKRIYMFLLKKHGVSYANRWLAQRAKSEQVSVFDLLAKIYK